jgi:hypothetical protein
VTGKFILRVPLFYLIFLFVMSLHVHMCGYESVCS